MGLLFRSFVLQLQGNQMTPRDANAGVVSEQPKELSAMPQYTTVSSETENLKRCTCCLELKPATLEYFGPHKRSKGGLRSVCRPCHNKQTMLSRLAQPQKTREPNLKRTTAVIWAQNMENPGLKRCTKCGIEKPATTEFFEFRANVKCGLYAECRACRNLRGKLKREKNPDYMRKWRRANPEKVREYSRKWYQANPDYQREQGNKRRALKLQNGGTHTVEDIQAQYKSQKGKCWWCGKKVGKKYDVDHRIPLSRGGSNAPENLVIACQFCNRSKHDKLAHEWSDRLL